MLPQVLQSYARACLREPYRFFFPLGAIAALMGIGHWLVYGLGWSEGYSGFFHALVQTQVYMSAFFLGFLMTAIPRFSATPHASKQEFGFFAVLVVAIGLALVLGWWVFAEALFIVLVGGLAVFIGGRFIRRQTVQPPAVEFLWIPVALVAGAMGAFFILGGQLGRLPSKWILTGRQLIEHGYLLAVVIGVAGFLAPRLMGRTEALLTSVRHPELLRKLLRIRVTIYGLFVFALGGSFVFERYGNLSAAYGLRAIILTTVFVWHRAWPFWPRTCETYVRLLWCSLALLLAGYWLIAFWPAYRKGFLHFSFLGGYSLMIFAVATMVILSHAGQAARLRRPFWGLNVAALGVFLALALRLSAIYVAKHYFLLLAMASGVWTAAAVLWLVSVMPYLVMVPAEDEFQKLHAKMKKKIMDSCEHPS